MELVDANIVLRYVLEDDRRLSGKTLEILENNRTFMTMEVACETVCVLQKVYKVDRTETLETFRRLFDQLEIRR